MRTRLRHATRTALAGGIALTVLITPTAAAAEPVDPSFAPPARTDRAIRTAAEKLDPALGITPQYLALMRKQEQLNAVAARIQDGHRKDRAGTGLSGLVVNPEKGNLQVYWHGRVPATVTRELNAVRAAGLTAEVRSAPYTFAQLDAAAADLADRYFGRGGTAQAVVSVSPKSDGTGLQVGVQGSGSDAQRVAAAIDTDVPVDPMPLGQPQAATRWHDQVAYWGGSYMVRQFDGAAQNSCSSAFGVTGLNGAATYLLTAAHCGEARTAGWRWATGSATYPDGSIRQNNIGQTITTRSTAHDGELILTSAGAAVYDGPSFWDGDTNTGRSVYGVERNFPGNIVCTGGAYSGTVCGGTRVAATGERIEISPAVNGVGVITGLVRAELPGVAIAGNGDSGGPVYSVRSTDGRVGARGVISAIPGCNLPAGATSCNPDNWITCTGYPGVADNVRGRHCSWRMWYGDMTTLTNALGVRVNTQ